MAITVYTEDQILGFALAYLQQAYPGKPVGPKSFLGQQARALAQLIGAIQQALQAADNDGVPAYDTSSAVIKSRCSSGALDNWAVTFGLPSNRGAGLFGRNAAQTATGGAGNVVGNPGVIVAGGALLVDPSGQIQVELLTGVTIPAGGSIAGSLQAVAAGAAGNLAAGTTLTWQSPPAGLQPTVTLSTALSGGYDIESDLALLQRLVGHLQAPPKGGTAHDYRVWAESALTTTGASVGISRAYVYPRRSGLGTEDIIITIAGSGQGRDPGATKLAQVQTYLDSVRPVNDTPTAVRPYFNLGRGLSLQIQVAPSPLYPWDWVDASFQLAANSTTSQLVVNNGALPGGLLTAYPNSPRIQLVVPSASPLPQVVQVTNITIGMLTTTLNVSPALSAAPGAGTVVWPAGGVVLPVALAVLGYIDSIGPSQQSGFWDSVTDNWEATVSVGKLAWAALGAQDGAGNRVAIYSPQVGNGVGIKIAIGAGPLGGSDVVLYDNVSGQGPELPWTSSIIVIPIQ